jgi:CRP-like cAMP-binding protein
MSSLNSDGNPNLKSKENKDEIENNDFMSKNLIAVKKLYPNLSIDGQFDKNLYLLNKEESEFKRDNNPFLNEENDKSTSLSEKFLKDLMKKPCPLEKEQIVNVMADFIEQSPLIQKFQKDVEKKLQDKELSRMGASILSYIEIKKGQILFRIGDKGDRFYFILSGLVSILKLKEINNVQMNYFEYLDYCMYLISQKELHIFNKVKNKNMSILPIESETEIINIYKVFFMKKLKEAILSDLVPDIKSLINYLKNYGFKLQDFNIKIVDLEKIENNNELDYETKKEEWNKFLIGKCKPSDKDLMQFQPYKSKFQDNKKNSITCYIYKPFLFLNKGLFFGDFALDSDINKRNATIRAEKDTILAFLKSSDYINLFAPRRKFEKMREISFLYTNYFFGNINKQYFEKNYFHLFSPHEFYRHNELFDFSSNIQSLILLKEGKISLEIKASIADLHDLIRYLWEHITDNKYFNNLSQWQKRNLISPDVLNRINEYIEEPIFSRLKSYGDKFFEEMTKIKTFQVYTLSNKEIIGLEEYYLGIPCIMKGIVSGNKINCYKIDIENFESILSQEKQIIYHFVKSSVNKIISLIDRFQSLKANHINMFKMKLDKELSDFKEVNKIDEDINDNNDNNEVKKNNSLNKLNNKLYKSPVKSISTNLNLINLEKLKISNIKYNLNSSLILKDKINFINKDSLINQYNNNIAKQTNESKLNNVSSMENNNITSENDKTNKTNKIAKPKKIIYSNSQRNLSYGNILSKHNSKFQLKKFENSIIKIENKMNQQNSIDNTILKNKILVKNTSTKNSISLIKSNPERKKIFIYRNFYIKKNIKNFIEKEPENYKPINSIWFGQKTRELKYLKNVNINGNALNDNKTNNNNVSLIDNNESNINNINIEEEQKNKKIAISNAIKNFYNEIKNRGYSSIVRNKKSNTILNRKNKRKYLSNFVSVSTSNNQNKSTENQFKKISVKLPLIKDKSNTIFS